MTEPARRIIDANGVSLNVFVLPSRQESVRQPVRQSARPPLVMLHGMRDVALSLLSVAEQLAAEFTVYLPDLRGHGLSDKPGSYAMPQYLFDLHRLIDDIGPAQGVALFGHSLGGHIVSRFAALYPDLVRAAVIVEGLGPPEGRFGPEPDSGLGMEGRRILETLGMPASQRPLPDLEFAAGRLHANNPRLDHDRALELARSGTARDADGNLVWAFDPRAGAVFLGLEGNEKYWSAIRCPTCVIAGTHAGEYWGRALPAGADWQGEFAPGELEARVALMADSELHELDGSGHMIHFDEPDRLAGVTLNFLRRRL